MARFSFLNSWTAWEGRESGCAPVLIFTDGLWVPSVRKGCRHRCPCLRPILGRPVSQALRWRPPLTHCPQELPKQMQTVSPKPSDGPATRARCAHRTPPRTLWPSKPFKEGGNVFMARVLTMTSRAGHQTYRQQRQKQRSGYIYFKGSRTAEVTTRSARGQPAWREGRFASRRQTGRSLPKHLRSLCSPEASRHHSRRVSREGIQTANGPTKRHSASRTITELQTKPTGRCHLTPATGTVTLTKRQQQVLA